MSAALTTVAIPTLDAPLIAEVVRSVLDQRDRERLGEILVAGRDAPGRLRAAGLLLPGTGVRFIDTGVPISEPAARNLLLRSTAAQRIVFLDSDCLAQPEWLRGHLAALDAGAAIVGGSVLPNGASYWALVYNLSMFYASMPSLPNAPRGSLPTLNLSLTRQAFEAVGPFDETLPRATDLDWTFRARQAGLELKFVPEAAVCHRHARHTLREVWRDCAGSGRYSRQIRLRYADRLGTPAWLRHRRLVRTLAPTLAAWVTARVLLRWPGTFRGRWHALPGFYLTKLAWGWGAGAR